MTSQIRSIRKKIVPVMKEYGVRKAAVFGSVARGTMRRGSDVDILVDFPPGTSLLDLVRLERELKELLKRDVDVVTYDSLHHLIRDRILREQAVIYETR